MLIVTASAVLVRKICNSHLLFFFKSRAHKFRKKIRQAEHCSNINLTVLHVSAHVQGHLQAVCNIAAMYIQYLALFKYFQVLLFCVRIF